MKYSIIYLTFGLLTACSLGGAMVTMDRFYDVDLSTSKEELVASLGEPYAVREKEDGSIEYEYVERIKIGSRNAEVRSYFIVMKDGVVVSKRVGERSPLPYYFDSYEMQTTQAEEVNP